jgi:hypothetical protein
MRWIRYLLLLLILPLVYLVIGCETVIIKVPPPCPEPGPNVGQQWEDKHCQCDGDNQLTVYQLAPAVGTYMAEIKRYCKGIDEFRKN